MSKQKLNVELFRKIRDRIAEIPESYDQRYWSVPSAISPCGTAACLAGEAIICNASTVPRGIAALKRAQASDSSSVPKRAAKLLGLPEARWDYYEGGRNETGVLFDSIVKDDHTLSVAWPARFRARYERAKTSRGRANAAVAYLDHIIKTGKVLE